jgi:hypothetical protein
VQIRKDLEAAHKNARARVKAIVADKADNIDANASQ